MSSRRSPLHLTYPGQSLLSAGFYALIRALAGWAFVVLYRARGFGAEHVPETGACLIASNHQSHLDPPLVSSGVRFRAIHFVAKAELFESRWFGWVIRTLRAVPIRLDGASDVTAVREILGRLEIGAAVLIFPEGARTLTGEMSEFQRGVWLLMKRAKCPVVPCAVEGCYEAFPRGTGFPKLWGKRVAVAYGKAITHEELLALGPDEALKRLAAEIEALRMGLRKKLVASS
ncbi:MAG: lysophospholipid acyltransferase family protein [Phycisphaerales bacterium]